MAATTGVRSWRMASKTKLPRYVAVTRVKTGHGKDFEGLIPAIAKAEAQTQSHSTSEWHLLRPDIGATGTNAAAYMFLFYGDVPLEELDLERIFIGAHGEEEGRRLIERFVAYTDGPQEVYAFSGEVAQSREEAASS
jgi:hypothetical protein